MRTNNSPPPPSLPPRHLTRVRVALCRLHIKGGAGDEAALCTSDRTYSVQLAEATNTLVRAPCTRSVIVCAAGLSDLCALLRWCCAVCGTTTSC